MAERMEIELPQIKLQIRQVLVEIPQREEKT